MKRDRYKIINKRKRFLVSAADRVLAAADRFGILHGRAGQPYPDIVAVAGSIRKILVVRLAYIGDVVMTLPVIEPLRAAFPNAVVTFLTSHMAAPLLQHHPGIDTVMEFNAPWFYPESRADTTRVLIRELRQAGFDLGIDFRGDIRNITHCLYRPRIRYRLSYTSGGGGILLTHPVEWTTLKHKVDYHLDLLRQSGISAPRMHPKIHLTNEEIAHARAMISSFPGCRDSAPVIIHPGARLPLKQWPAARFIELIRLINARGLGPVALIDTAGSPIGSRIAAEVPVDADLRGQLSIRDMAAMMSLARVVICHDSGPMHIAAAAGARVIALFGPSRPIETAPCGEGHTVIEAPCEWKDACDESTCIAGHPGGCMDRIDVAVVLSAIESL